MQFSSLEREILPQMGVACTFSMCFDNNVCTLSANIYHRNKGHRFMVEHAVCTVCDLLRHQENAREKTLLGSLGGTRSTKEG